MIRKILIFCTFCAAVLSRPEGYPGWDLSGMVGLGREGEAGPTAEGGKDENDDPYRPGGPLDPYSSIVVAPPPGGAESPVITPASDYDDDEMEHSTAGGPELTDIPQSDVDDALRIDDGYEYEPMKFNYINDQFVGWQNASSNYVCYDDYIRCLITQSIREPICAQHTHRSTTGTNKLHVMKSLGSICTLYFDNCRRRARFWWLMKVGVCAFYTYKINKEKKTRSVIPTYYIIG